jgi:hypothetical protein
MIAVLRHRILIGIKSNNWKILKINIFSYLIFIITGAIKNYLPKKYASLLLISLLFVLQNNGRINDGTKVAFDMPNCNCKEALGNSIAFR